MDNFNENMMFNEYKMLRDEITYHMKLHNTLVTFTITSVVAVLGITLSLDNVYYLLLPFAILIPMSARISYYRRAMTKLSAYMIVFLEPNIQSINWETRNLEFLRLQSNKPNHFFDRFSTLRYYECSILSVIITIAFYIKFINEQTCVSLINLPVLLMPILGIFYIIYATYRTNQIDADREKWIVAWKLYKISNPCGTQGRYI